MTTAAQQNNRARFGKYHRMSSEALYRVWKAVEEDPCASIYTLAKRARLASPSQSQRVFTISG